MTTHAKQWIEFINIEMGAFSVKAKKCRNVILKWKKS